MHKIRWVPARDCTKEYKWTFRNEFRSLTKKISVIKIKMKYNILSVKQDSGIPLNIILDILDISLSNICVLNAYS